MGGDKNVLGHYLAGTMKNDTKVKGNKTVVSKTVQKSSGAVSLFGLLLTFIGIIMFSASEEDEIRRPIKVIGWGMLFLFVGPSVPLHLLLIKSKQALKVKLVYGLMTTALYALIANSFAVAYYADGLPCQPWFPGYNPDGGSCTCDERELLTTNDSPFFIPREEFSLPTSIKIASIGDTTVDASRIAMQIAKERGVDLFVVNGDLTYVADIEGFDNVLTEVLGDSFPVMITVGNHDTGIFTEYQKVIQDRYARYRANVDELEDQEYTLKCEGMIGVSGECSFFNMALFFNGLGSTCSNDDFLNEELKDGLRRADRLNVLWRLVFIHKNQRLLQTGGKRDEVGWSAFENSLQYGAFVFNGHEHTYARTKQLHGVGPEPEDFVFPEEAEVYKGVEVINLDVNSFGVCSNGLGGKSIRDVEDDLEKNPWWAKTFHDASENINSGLQICEYGVDGQDNLAYCYFETTDGFVVDQYYVRANH